MNERWDETWHRLREWTNGQGQSERLAALVLSAAGYEDVDPSHPLGGRDGGKDAIAVRDGGRWVMAVYFARGQQPYAAIKHKLIADYVGVARNGAVGLAFVTNQEVRLAERDDLAASVPGPLDLLHLERLVQLLDQPRMHRTRRQFLGVGQVVRPTPPDVRPLSDADDNLFVAREQELDQIQSFLRAESDKSVYVVSGLPGGGKTALAQRAVATAIQDGRFTGGGFSVDMRGYDIDVDSAIRGQDVYAGALRALGAEVASEEAELPAQYHALLQEREESNRPVVILLDNVVAASQITPLLPRSRLHRVVVTSRSDIAPLLPNSAGAVLAPLPHTAAALVLKAVCGDAGRPLTNVDMTRSIDWRRYAATSRSLFAWQRPSWYSTRGCRPTTFAKNWQTRRIALTRCNTRIRRCGQCSARRTQGSGVPKRCASDTSRCIPDRSFQLVPPRVFSTRRRWVRGGCYGDLQLATS